MNTLTIMNQTMSSKEIAELTGKQHAHVMRDIKNMLTDLNLPALNFEDTHINPQIINRIRKLK